ncbi:MAG: hypothetical protein AAF311_07250 [Pseudomonadota bacterium]
MADNVTQMPRRPARPNGLEVIALIDEASREGREPTVSERESLFRSFSESEQRHLAELGIQVALHSIHSFSLDLLQEHAQIGGISPEALETLLREGLGEAEIALLDAVPFDRLASRLGIVVR